MTRKELANKIFDVSHIRGEFTLRSGKTSNEYFDKYLFECEPVLLDAITEHLLNVMSNDFDVLAALEMGGIPIATMLSQKTGKQIAFVRKKAKEYGTCKLAEGAAIEGNKLLIVEDVVTSGGQIVISAMELRERGAIINEAVCVIDRQSGGMQNLANAGIKLLPLFKMDELKNQNQ